MDTTRDTVCSLALPLVAELCTVEGVSARVLTDLSYDPADPFAVTMIFRTSPRPVAWTFARDLFTSGVAEPTGDGDVHVWPCLDDDGQAVVMVELCSPDGDVLVQLCTHDVITFLDRAEETVPTGTEADHLDVDAAIAAVLGLDAV